MAACDVVGDGRAGYLRAPAVTPLLTAFDVDEPIVNAT